MTRLDLDINNTKQRPRGDVEFELLKYQMKRLIGDDGEEGLIAIIRKKMDRLTVAVLTLAILIFATNPNLLKLILPLFK